MVENYQKSLNYAKLFHPRKSWENVSFSSDFLRIFTEQISGFAPCDYYLQKQTACMSNISTGGLEGRHPKVVHVGVKPPMYAGAGFSADRCGFGLVGPRCWVPRVWYLFSNNVNARIRTTLPDGR